MLSVSLLLAAASASQPAVDGELDERHKRALSIGGMLFDRSDADADGQLNRDEMRKTLRLASLVVRDAELDRGTMDERIDAVLKRFDSNKDGQMSRAEMRRLILSRMAESDARKG